MRFGFLFGSILLCLFAPLPEELTWYFAAQLVYTVGTQVVKMDVGSDSAMYTAIWGLGTALILVASAHLVGRVRIGIAATGSLLGASLGILSLYGIPKPWVASDWVNVGTGTALVGLAWCLGKQAVEGRCSLPQPQGILQHSGEHRAESRNECEPSTAIILSLLWLTLAAWSFGWPIHFRYEVWRRLNWVIPTWACVVTFTWIGGWAWLKKLA